MNGMTIAPIAHNVRKPTVRIMIEMTAMIPSAIDRIVGSSHAKSNWRNRRDGVVMVRDGRRRSVRMGMKTSLLLLFQVEPQFRPLSTGLFRGTILPLTVGFL